jgi:hypothetical protein
MPRDDDVEAVDGALLADHARYGCLSVVCRAANGPRPSIFARRDLMGRMPSVQLSIVRHAGRLGDSWRRAAYCAI